MLSTLAATVTPLTSSLCTESGAYCVRPLTGDLCIDSAGYCDWLYKTGFAIPIRHGAPYVYTEQTAWNISQLYQLDAFFCFMEMTSTEIYTLSLLDALPI